MNNFKKALLSFLVVISVVGVTTASFTLAWLIPAGAGNLVLTAGIYPCIVKTDVYSAKKDTTNNTDFTKINWKIVNQGFEVEVNEGSTQSISSGTLNINFGAMNFDFFADIDRNLIDDGNYNIINPHNFFFSFVEIDYFKEFSKCFVTCSHNFTVTYSGSETYPNLVKFRYIETSAVASDTKKLIETDLTNLKDIGSDYSNMKNLSDTTGNLNKLQINPNGNDKYSHGTLFGFYLDPTVILDMYRNNFVLNTNGLNLSLKYTITASEGQ
jgi:hypothetical protein